MIDEIKVITDIGSIGVVLWMLYRSEARFDRVNQRLLDMLERMSNMVSGVSASEA